MKLEELVNGLGDEEFIKHKIYLDAVKDVAGEILYVGELDFVNYRFNVLATNKDDERLMNRYLKDFVANKDFGDILAINNFIKENNNYDYLFVIYNVEGSYKFKAIKLD